MQNTIIRSGAVIVALVLAGCAAPAATLLSPAVSGAPAVADFLGGEESESFWVARQADVAAAARSSGDAFGLDLTREEQNDERILLVFTDSADKKFRLRLEKRSDVLTYVRFNGASGLTRLFSRQMTEVLKEADAFQVDWAEERGGFAR